MQSDISDRTKIIENMIAELKELLVDDTKVGFLN